MVAKKLVSKWLGWFGSRLDAVLFWFWRPQPVAVRLPVRERLYRRRRAD